MTLTKLGGNPPLVVACAWSTPFGRSLRMTQTNNNHANDPHLSRKELEVLTGLKKTALKEALKRPGAPAPIRYNQRVFRYRLSEVLAWIDSLQKPRVAVSPAVAYPAAPSVRTGGRRSKYSASNTPAARHGR